MFIVNEAAHLCCTRSLTEGQKQIRSFRILGFSLVSFSNPLTVTKCITVGYLATRPGNFVIKQVLTNQIETCRGKSPKKCNSNLIG